MTTDLRVPDEPTRYAPKNNGEMVPLADDVLVGKGFVRYDSYAATRAIATAAVALVGELRASRDDAEGKLASLADTVASALRNNGHNSDHIKLDTDLRDSIWQLSYDFISQQQRASAAEAECERMRGEIFNLSETVKILESEV